MARSIRLSFILAIAFSFLFAITPTRAELTLEKGDHVVLIGNTLADRMQHHGWLETLIQARFPEYELVFRNLGFSADEINTRPRSQNFGSPDQWLTKTKADVVFAFFGYNESFAGEGGLEKFRRELAGFIDHTLKQNYSGKGTPQLVLFSPIAHEDLKRHTLPDGSENNKRLAMYTKAMGEVARDKGVVFVDLFNPTQTLYKTAPKPLTMNGIHLLEHGNREVAEVIVGKLFPDAKAAVTEESQLQKLREAVLDKNFHWFNLYRTVDGYNVFGGRSRLNWHGQSNADVMAVEMESFNVMTANRDKRVWAIARGGDLVVKDDNLPKLPEVKTNKPGPLDDGRYPFLGGKEAIGKMKIHDGMQVNLFASEEMFPELINPVQMSVDPDGRLWVATWPSYPHWNPHEERRDKLVILPDEDGDGVADKMITFADGLNSVTGFEFWGGGVLVAAAPEIWFLKDTDGDDKADVKIRMLQGVSSADTHHTANALVIGPDGGLYMSRGVFHVDNMETPTGTFRSTRSGVYRFDPRTFEFTFHFPIGPNPHGDVFDQWGYQFATDGTSGTGNYIAIGKGVGAPKQWYKKRVRPVAATGILSSSHFPEVHQGNFLICNVIGVLGVLQHEVRYDGADITAHEVEPILTSSDPNFRPTDLEVGGDGALYVSDWHNPLIGHMQHNMRDPNRDDQHGRIYRVTYKGRPLLKPVKLVGKPIDEVLAAFYAKENGTRYRARLELSGRDTKQVVAAVSKWTATIEPSSPADEQALLEALWVLQEHRVPNRDLLAKVLKAGEPRVRAAAIRTLGDWGEKIDNWQPLLLAAARDESALVRAEAAIAAVSFDGLAAAEAIFEVATRPTDVQLDFNLNYAKGKINVDRIVQDALDAGKPLSKAARTYAVQKANVATLLKMQRDEAVNLALVSRGGVPARERLAALDALAKANGSSPAAELIAAISREENNPQGGMGDLLNLLAEMDAAALRAQSNKLEALASNTSTPAVRQAAYVAWITAAGSADDAWRHASEQGATLRDLLIAYPTLKNHAARESLYPKVRALMFDLPDHLEPKDDAASPAFGLMQVEYYLPARKTADPAAYASIQPTAVGKARRITIDDAPVTTRDNFALVFTGTIEIPRDGKYTFYTNSDDGSRLYIDGQLVVDNDGLHGMSEKGGNVRLTAGPHRIVVGYFDNGGGDGLVVSWRGPRIQKEPIPADVLGGAGGGSLADLAIRALAATGGREAEKISDFAKLITSQKHVASALGALASLPRDTVKKQLDTQTVERVVTTLVAHADKATPVERDTAAYARMLRLGDDLVANAKSRGPLRRKLAALRDSIPVQADPAVMARGREVYFRESHCATCHQADGKGMPNLYPPIDDSPWVTGSEERLIRMTLYGMHGTITVKGETYSSPPLPPMTGFHSLLNDEEIAAVLTYVRNSWSNRAKPIDTKTVAQVRQATKGDSTSLEAYALLQQFPMEDGSMPAQRPADDAWAPKFVKTWTMDDFAGDLSADFTGRSFENGKLAFTNLGCAQCHKLGETGGALGPDLGETFKKYKHNRRDVLAQIVEPSKVVEEKFKAVDIETLDGERLYGLVTERTKDHVLIVTNPQNPTPRKIAIDDIHKERSSKFSMMPQGLLNVLTREQILDLLAYLESRGDKEHELYEKH